MTRAIPILFEDDALLAVSKPAGVASAHDPARPEENIVEMLAGHYSKLWPVHRLDRETSGVLLFARTAEAHAALNAAFEAREVAKVYNALVNGQPRWEERTVDAPLLPNGDRKHRTIVDAEDGKPSITHFKVLQRVTGVSLVEARPLTGRTHQVRVHLAVTGSPIACDALYGNGKPILLSAFKKSFRQGSHDERPLLGRLGLHALSLTVRHPVTGESLFLEAPLAKDMGATLNQLSKL